MQTYVLGMSNATLSIEGASKGMGVQGQNIRSFLKCARLCFKWSTVTWGLFCILFLSRGVFWIWRESASHSQRISESNFFSFLSFFLNTCLWLHLYHTYNSKLKLTIAFMQFCCLCELISVSFSLSLMRVLENSVLEINHVTNVTTVLDETAASDRVSRSYFCEFLLVSHTGSQSQQHQSNSRCL